MDRSKRISPVVGAAAAAVALAVAMPATSWAEPVEMSAQSSHRTTFDGWNLTVALSGEVINAVPNLAGAQNSREAFMTLSAQANIVGSGSNPISSANFVAGYQVGCQIDVSQGLQIGGTAQLAGSVGANISAQPGVQAGGSGAIGGFVQTDLQPGVITTVTMGTMAVTAGMGRLDMQDVHLKVDACGGPVTVRSYATFAVASAVQQTQLSVYGDPYVLN
ncbi:MspA protein [Mycobacteroides abscessus subsp. bolletii]|nr:MspA protein [Mycobacteroides abscessus subsp. bolletii]SKF72259.1 MspA protein [Mycobacteroides abscessus subsp. bolletii]SPX82281.1 membrane protein [Mycobacteroides abscessus]